MRGKSLIGFLVCIVSFGVVVAQESKTEYLDLYHQTVEKQESYSYQVGSFDQFGWQDTVKGYFTRTDSIFFIAFYENGKRNGKYIQYYENGKKEYESDFQDGEKVGESSFFYPTGQQWKVLAYSGDSKTQELIHYWDSTGNVLVQNGSGHGQFCYVNKFLKNGSIERDLSCETGSYESGLKTGKWTGTLKDGAFNETYEKGNLTGGELTRNSGEKFYYSKIEESADFPGGINKFYSSIGKKMGSYPKGARRSNIEGAVLIQFEIDKEGLAVNHIVFRGIGYGCDEVALAAVKSVNEKWIPGKQRGVNVRQRMIIPIMFKLN